MHTRNYILTYINGKQYKITGKYAFNPLSDFLRYDLQLVGTKIVCSEGDCGSCTVVQGKLKNGKPEYKIINSCIKYMHQLDCSHIITVEGLKDNWKINPVQESMVNHHGSQCGFCTPGFVVAMTTLFENKIHLDHNDLKRGLTGNLCRCTGYQQIIEAGTDVNGNEIKKFDMIYPPENVFKSFSEVSEIPVLIESDGKKVFIAGSVAEAVSFKSQNNNTVIVSGGTDTGVQLNKKLREAEVILDISSLKELNEINTENDYISVGAGVTLSRLMEYSESLYPEFHSLLKVFGSPQIRNSGTIGGNIANASPIADTVPFLFVIDAELELTGSNGKRKVKISDFYKGYKVFDLNKDEIITKVYIPLLKNDYNLKLFKVSKRKDLDIATFTAAFMYKEIQGKIEDINISYGGVAPVVLRLPKTEGFLRGKTASESDFRKAGRIACDEIYPISDVRGSKDFRSQLAENIMMKFYFECFEKEKVLCP